MEAHTIKSDWKRFISNPVLDLLLTGLLKNNKMLKTLKKVLTILILFKLLPCTAQTSIPGSINTSVSLPNVERNFTGFNSGIGNLECIYNLNGPTTGLEVNPNFFDAFAKLSNRVCWRFPGGTTSSSYNRWGSGYGNSGSGQTFGEYLSFLNVNPTLQNNIYSNYYNYSNYSSLYPYAKNNIIFPFINSITKNRTATNNAVFCINMVNHYRSLASVDTITLTNKILYDTRTETLRDTNKIKAINNLSALYLDAFNKSTLSAEFKKVVRQNIDAFLTLINNNVSVYKVELGSELFGYQFNDNYLVDYNAFISNTGTYSVYFPSDAKVWIKDDGSAQSIKDSYASLWTYAHLAKLYKVLLTDTLQKLSLTQPGNAIYSNHLKNIKFGVPVTPILNSGFKKWDDFMRQADVKKYIGIDAYVIHPYLDSSNYYKGYNFTPSSNVSSTDLTKEFNDIRDTMEIAYNSRFFKKNHISLINALPSGSDVWYTEWDFNFDNCRLMKVGNTLLHAMYYYDAIMNFFDINANKNLQVSVNKTNPVKLCNYQLPYTKSLTWYPMTRFSGGYSTANADPYTTTNNVANTVKYNANYYAQLLLAPVLNDDSILYLNNVNGGFTKMTNCSFRSFYKKVCTSTCCTDNVYIYFNNKSGTDYKIDLVSSLGITDANCVKTTKNYLYANNLYASMGQTSFRTDDLLYTANQGSGANVTIQRIFNQDVPDSLLNQTLISKYSMGFIKVEITMPTATCNCITGTPVNSNTKFISSESIFQSVTTPEKKADLAGNLAFRIYPNPNTSGELNMDIPSAKEVTAEIIVFDLSGNLVRTFSKELLTGQNSLQIDLSGLAKATYIIRVNGDEIHHTEKVILQ